MIETREEAIAALVAESKRRNAGIIPWPARWTWEEQRDATVEIVVERLVEHLIAHPDVARVLLGADREPEADPLAHVKVGDPDPTPNLQCSAPLYVDDGYPWVCNREPGHPGQHIAGDGDEVLAVWPAAQAQPKAGERA